MGTVLLDAFLDTLKLFPIILIVYILMELLEQKTNVTRNGRLLRGGWAPLIGATTGIIPECGFSVMAAELYGSGKIRTGTLMAVFIATSDEALIILLAGGSSAISVIPLILIKIVVAAAVGYLVNAVYRRDMRPASETEGDERGNICGKGHEGEKPVMIYFVHPLLHSLKIAAYILIVNLVFGIVVYFVGEDAITESLVGGPYLQPLICAAVGLIPNCVSSTILAGAYMNGGIMFGSMVAGLCANAGIGLMVLFRDRSKAVSGVVILVALFVVGSLAGMATNAVLTAAGVTFI